jgi:hypothetical protein
MNKAAFWSSQGWQWRLLCMLILGCAAPGIRQAPHAPRVKGLTKPAASPERFRNPPQLDEVAPAKEFLRDGYDEDQPIRLFGYVILRQSEPLAATPRNLALIQAFWAGLEPVRPYVDFRLRGTMFWPLHSLSPDEIQNALEHGNWATFLDHYHGARARLILSRCQLEAGVGPLVIVATQPLGQMAGSFTLRGKQALVIDCSNIGDEQFMRVFQLIQSQVMEGNHFQHDAWDLRRIQDALQPIFGQQISGSVQLAAIRSN